MKYGGLVVPRPNASVMDVSNAEIEPYFPVGNPPPVAARVTMAMVSLPSRLNGVSTGSSWEHARAAPASAKDDSRRRVTRMDVAPGGLLVAAARGAEREPQRQPQIVGQARLRPPDTLGIVLGEYGVLEVGRHRIQGVAIEVGPHEVGHLEPQRGAALGVAEPRAQHELGAAH